MEEKRLSPHCAKCTGETCRPEKGAKERPALDKAPASCPMKVMAGTLEQAQAEYENPEGREIARQAAIQAAQCFENTPQGRIAKHSRLVEMAQFAKKMGYRKLGLAFCDDLASDAVIVANLFENQGFEVVSARCKLGGIPKEQLGIKPEQKINGPAAYESMCNPIAQAAVMNEAQVDMAVVMGLCMGQDILFFQHCRVPVTVFAVKDRAMGHNPLSAINPLVIFSTEFDREMR